MKYFRFQIDKSEIHLYPIVCLHVGAKQHSETLTKEVIKQIKADPLAKWIYMGDGGECVTLRSKGNLYEQLLNPGDQLRVCADYLIPIKDKGLFGIRGNHGNRIDKDSGIGWDEMLCSRIGIPYFGVSALGSLALTRPNNGQKKDVSLYVHHGSAGAIGPAGKMAAGHKPEALVDADIALTAHTHACGECWPARHIAYVNGKGRDVLWRTMRSFVCGSAYDSRSGYAEEKQYPVILPEHIVVNIKLTHSNNYDKVEITSRSIKVDF